MLREACAEEGLGFAFLAIALDDETGLMAGQEQQLVPVRDRLEHREAAHPVPAELGLHVDVVDYLRGEDAAVPEHSLAVAVNRRHVFLRLSVLTAGVARCFPLASPVTGRACVRPARGCRSSTACVRTRTCGTRPAARSRRCRACARETRHQSPSALPRRSPRRAR